MSKKIKISLISIISIITLSIAFMIINNNQNIKLSNNKELNKILNSKDYAYLPTEAKEYIVGVYEEEGAILLTEKNKEDNEPYLNPDYVEYLTASDEEKASLAYIPEPTRFDYVYDASITKASSTSLPTSYDLRNVDGVNYAPTLKNQGSLNLCWAFATNSSIESKMMKANLATHSNPVIFSERQVDYATAKSTTKEGYNPYESDRSLNSGGAFRYVEPLLVSGISPVEKTGTWSNNTMTATSLSLKNIFDNSNTVYTVTGYFKLPFLNRYASDETKEQWRNKAKQYIMDNGSLHVATIAPGTNCTKLYNGTFIINVTSTCTPESDSGHSMSIIGWNDNYVYSYFDGDDLITVEGAWILQNSWGDTYTYGYLAYDSEVTEATGISDIKVKDWDNNYNETISSYEWDSDYESATANITYYKIPNNVENLKRISINVYGYNIGYNQFNVYLKNGMSDYTYLGQVDLNDNGVVSLDTSNIALSSDSFSIKVVNADTTAKGRVIGISAYTSNPSSVSQKVEMRIEPSNYPVSYDSDEYTIDVVTSGIDTGSLLTYKLYNENNTAVTSGVTIENSYVLNNNSTSYITIDSTKFKSGTYTLKASLNDTVVASEKFYYKTFSSGTGTESDPFLVSKVSDFEAMCSTGFLRKSYYKLKNDIDFSNYNTTSWIPLCNSSSKSFSGAIDGAGFSIYGLTINNSSSNMGLFGYAEDATIKNLAIMDAIVKSGDNSGILIGVSRNVTLDQIALRANINATNNIGGLIGKSESNTKISNVYSLINYTSGSTWDNAYAFASSKDNLSINDSYAIVALNSSNIKRYIYDNNTSYEKTLTELKTKNTYTTYGFNFDSIWTYKDESLISLKSISNMFRNKVTTNFPSQSDSLSVGDHIDLSITDDNVKFNGFIYKSSNESVATVNSLGDVTIVGEGNAIIYIVSRDGFETTLEYPISLVTYGVEYSDLKVDSLNKNKQANVSFKLTTTGFDFDKDKITLKVYDPSNTDITKNTSVTYEETSNKNETTVKLQFSYANISADGDYKIEISCDDCTTKTATFKVDKYIDVTGITFENNELTIGLNSSFKLESTVTPSNSTDKSLSWSSSDTSVVTVDENGGIKGIKVGTANITVKSVSNTNISSTIKVNVVDFEIAKVTKSISCTDENACNLNFNIEINTSNLDGKLNVQILDSTGKIDNSTFTVTGGTISNNKANIKLITQTVSGKYEVKIYYNESISKSTSIDLATAGTYSVKFDANGGTGAMTPMTLELNEGKKLTANSFTKTGYKFKYWSTKADGRGDIYNDSDYVVNLSDGSDVTLYAIWDLDGYKISVYNYSDDYISKISLKTSLKDYLKNFELPSDYKVSVYTKDNNSLGENDLVATGSITKIYQNDTLVKQYTNIVLGDVTGTGTVTINDVAKLYQHLKGKELIKDNCYIQAGNVVRTDNVIKANDIAKLYQFVKKKINSLE